MFLFLAHIFHQLAAAKSPNNPNITFLYFCTEHIEPSLIESILSTVFKDLQPATSALFQLQSFFPDVLQEITVLIDEIAKCTNPSEKHFLEAMTVRKIILSVVNIFYRQLNNLLLNKWCF